MITAEDGTQVLFPVEFHIHDDYGQNRTVRYQSVRINQSLDDVLFRFVPPSDAVVMDKQLFKDVDASIARCKRQLETRSGDVHLHYTLAQLYLRKRPIDWKAVNAHYARVAELQPTSRAWTDLAWSHFRLEQYNDAIRAAKRALELNPEDDAAYAYLADAYEKKGDLANYIACQRHRLESEHVSESVKLHVCGELAQKCGKGQLEQLAADTKTRIASDTNEIWPYGMLGFCYHHLSQPDQARPAFREAVRRLLERTPQQGVGWLLERTIKSLGMYEELAKVYERQLEIAAGQIHRERGIRTQLLGPYLHFGRTEEASDIYWNLLTHGGIYAATRRYQGVLWEAMGNWLDKLKDIADAMEGLPETPALCILRSTIYRHETGDTERALALAKRAVELAPEDPFVHAALGEIHFDLSAYAEASACYHRAMELDPDQPYHRAMLAFCYNGMREHEEAIQIAEELDEYLNCDKPSFHSILGTVYFNAGRTSDKRYYRKAIDEFAQALAETENNSKLYYCRLAKSICHDQLGESDQAEFAYEADFSWWMFRERMYSLRHAENPDGMLKLARKHLVNGRYSDINLLTRLMMQMGEKEKLIAFYGEELARDPHPIFYAQLGEVHFEGKDYERAIPMYEKALELGLSHAGWTKHHLVQAYVEQRGDERAIELLEEMLNGGDGWYYDDLERLAVLLERTGRKEAAAYWADELPTRQHYPGRAREIAEIPRARARMYLFSEQYEQAVELFQEALRIEPEHAETKLKLAECYEQLGRRDAAADIRAHVADAQGRQACMANLQVIGEALAAYIREHGHAPDWLHELCEPGKEGRLYIADLSVFHCPADMSEGSYTLSPADPNLKTSYRYQFNAAPHREPKLLPSEDERVVHTWKDFKEYQRKYFGDVVPIVRCSHHPGVTIDLTYGGDVVENPRTWETAETGIQGMLSVMRETMRTQPGHWTEIFSPRKVVAFFRQYDALDRFASLFEPLRAEFAHNEGVRALTQEIASSKGVSVG